MKNGLDDQRVWQLNFATDIDQEVVTIPWF